MPATWIGRPPVPVKRSPERLAGGAESDALELGAVGRFQDAAHVGIAHHLGKAHARCRKGEARVGIALAEGTDAGDEIQELVGDAGGRQRAVDVEARAPARLADTAGKPGLQEFLERRKVVALHA